MIKKALVVLSIASTALLAQGAEQLNEIPLNQPLKVKSADIIAAANEAIGDAVYWEDDGYEFKQLSDSTDVAITQLYLDSKKQVQKLELTGSARVGGFGWHEGYQEGTADCVIEIEKKNGKWPADGSTASAECEITLGSELW